MGAPRMTKRDRWKRRPCVLRYFAFRDKVRKYDLPDLNGKLITFYLPIPQSWSKKRKAEAENQPHQLKPDIDNLLKALFDAALKEDSGIYSIRAEKRYSETPRIVIS